VPASTLRAEDTGFGTSEARRDAMEEMGISRDETMRERGQSGDWAGGYDERSGAGRCSAHDGAAAGPVAAGAVGGEAEGEHAHRAADSAARHAGARSRVNARVPADPWGRRRILRATGLARRLRWVRAGRDGRRAPRAGG